MKAMIKQIEGCSFIGKTESNHWVTIDTKKEALGSDAAAHPMELILLALGSCSGCDVVSILKKKQVTLHGFEVYVDAERSETHPKVFTRIHLEYVFFGKELTPGAFGAGDCTITGKILPGVCDAESYNTDYDVLPYC